MVDLFMVFIGRMAIENMANIPLITLAIDRTLALFDKPHYVALDT